MRHRRRLTTQTVRKRRPTGTHPQVSISGKRKKSSPFLKRLIYFIILVGLIYSAYIWLWPMVGMVKLPKFESLSQPKEQLPVENQQTNQTSNKASELPLTPLQKKIQIEVLNGCGEQGIAKILGERLIKHDYDIVNSGNYIENGKTNFNVENTYIIDQLKTQDNLIKSKELAAFVGIPSDRVESFENPAPIADITIVIGKDFKTLPVLNKD